MKETRKGGENEQSKEGEEEQKYRTEGRGRAAAGTVQNTVIWRQAFSHDGHLEER